MVDDLGAQSTGPATGVESLLAVLDGKPPQELQGSRMVDASVYWPGAVIQAWRGLADDGKLGTSSYDRRTQVAHAPLDWHSYR